MNAAATTEGPPAPARRMRVSILELMGLVGAAAVCCRWPGLGVPVGLAALDVLARRRDLFARPTRAAIEQLVLALYLPTALGLLWAPFWWWDTYLGYVSLLPTFIPSAGVLGLITGVNVTQGSPAGTAGMVLLSLIPPVAIAGLVPVVRRGLAWRVACLVLAAGLSTFSLFVFIVLMSMPT